VDDIFSSVQMACNFEVYSIGLAQRYHVIFFPTTMNVTIMVLSEQLQ